MTSINEMKKELAEEKSNIEKHVADSIIERTKVAEAVQDLQDMQGLHTFLRVLNMKYLILCYYIL